MSSVIGHRATCWDLIELVRQVHPREEDFSEGDLFDRIKRFGVYVLEEIALSNIHRGVYELDEELMEEYAVESVGTQPPIIVTDPFDGKRDIVDGNHRVEAQAKRGHQTILGFVPLEGTRIEDDDDGEED